MIDKLLKLGEVVNVHEFLHCGPGGKGKYYHLSVKGTPKSVIAQINAVLSKEPTSSWTGTCADGRTYNRRWDANKYISVFVRSLHGKVYSCEISDATPSQLELCKITGE